MTRRLPVAVALAAMLIAGCGGSRHATSTPRSRTSTAQGAATTAAAATATVTSSPSSTAATTSRPPEVPAGRAQTSTGSAHVAPDTNIHLPASFQIQPGGVLNPPLISAPAGVSIQLRLADLDSRPHAFRLAAPRQVPIRLAPHGRRTALISGLRNGTYRILVDGATRGQVVIGSVPGP